MATSGKKANDGKPTTGKRAPRRKAVGVSFKRDILPMYTDTDVEHMAFFCDLRSYDDNKANADDILKHLKADGVSLMPPGKSWTKTQIDLYETWIAEKFPK